MPPTRQRPQLDIEAERIEWQDFFEQFASRYEQDQHVSLIGPTRTGKTFLAREILELRECVIVIATKPKDKVVEAFTEYGYRIQEALDIPMVETKSGMLVPHPSYRRIVLWPRAQKDRNGQWMSVAAITAYQCRAIKHSLDYVRRALNWTLFTDDVNTLSEREAPSLNLGQDLKWIWKNGASSGISLTVAGQRPSWIPRDAYSAPEHLFFFATRDGNDLERLADVGSGMDTKQLEHLIANLRRHEFLYMAPREHPPILQVSKVEL